MGKQELISKNPKDIMGNPQERRLGWLGGVIDGEGTISIQKITFKKTGQVRLTPYVCVVNTDVSIMNEVLSLLDELGIKSRVYPRKIGTRKMCYQLRTDGVKAVTKLLSVLKSYLVGKKIQAVLVLNYINQRQEKYISRDGLGRLRRRPYDTVDISFYNEIKKLHHVESSETLRWTGTRNPDDKVQSLVKYVETRGTK